MRARQAATLSSAPEPIMLTLYDYLPSQNGYKIRLLLAQLGRIL